ncbi:transposase [Paracoccus sp. MC1862]|nr:transposase [Paracoccus sp. MC1854]MBB1496976.1 transposase [Paracoccus sp. MC1862]QQO44611.1 transposase [Paracoccus sp. MC1862]
MSTILHAITHAQGRPIRFFMAAGQNGDYVRAVAFLSDPPAAEWLLADTGCDAEWFREALRDKGIRACIPSRKSRAKPIRYDKRRYRRRNRIEIMFGRVENWRRRATQLTTDARRSAFPRRSVRRSPATTVIFWL